MGNARNPKRKRFEDMSRDELLTSKVEVEQQLVQVNAKIREIQAGIVARGRSPSITDYPREEQKRTTLSWLITQIEKQLRKNKMAEGSSGPSKEAEIFQRTAQQLLEPSLYAHLLQQTREQLS